MNIINNYIMKIITWNVSCLPKLINFYRNPTKKIVNSILDTIDSKKADIVKLQEVFDYKAQALITNHFKKKGYHLHYSEKDSTCYKSITMSKNGLVTATKYPILDKNLYEFQNNTSVESMIQKGILTTTIIHPIHGPINLHNTHIQSDSLLGLYSKCRQVRNEQFVEFYHYINSFGDYEKHIISGDFNEDFNDSNLREMIKNFKYDIKMNEDKIMTFPYCNRQLDYILCANFGKGNQMHMYDDYGIAFENDGINLKYSVDENKLSDHFMLSAYLLGL